MRCGFRYAIRSMAARVSGKGSVVVAKFARILRAFSCPLPLPGKIPFEVTSSMPTPFESAQLNLQIFDLRREPVLREARAWFLNEFNPESFDQLMVTMRSDRNPSLRMVLGYWEMAASMVTTGAIDAAAFRAAHSEIIGTFAKLHPFLKELRESFGEPELFRHLETVVMATPDAEALLARRRDSLRAAARARQSKEKTA